MWRVALLPSLGVDCLSSYETDTTKRTSLTVEITAPSSGESVPAVANYTLQGMIDAHNDDLEEVQERDRVDDDILCESEATERIESCEVTLEPGDWKISLAATDPLGRTTTASRIVTAIPAPDTGTP